MGKSRKLKASDRRRELSLEEQLRDLDDSAPAGPVWSFDKLMPPSAERVAYVRQRQELVTRLRRREAKAMADTGPDASGNFGVSPYAARGHVVEAAPKDLGNEIPKHSNKPDRIATQRVIDRYRAQGFITVRQWRAADRFWRIWRETGRDPCMSASYSPDQIRGSQDPDARMVGRSAAVAELDECRRLLGVLGFGCLTDIIIWDLPAGAWARTKRTSARDSAAVGMAFLRQGLDLLQTQFRY